MPSATIVVAEDYAPIRDLISRLLQSAGYTVHLAADGAELLDHVHAHTPDLILTDVDMPVLDGLAATAQLRAAPSTAATPIIAMSGDEHAGARTLIAGADVFLLKPFRLDDLLHRVADLLARRHAHA